MNNGHHKEAVVRLKKEFIYSCNICSRAYLKKYDYFRHIFSHVNYCYVKLEKKQIYKCKYCSAGYYSRDDRNLHLLHHVVEKVKKKRMKIAADRKHYGTNHIARSLKCAKCSREFVHEDTLKEHSKLHEPFPYICFCGIGYLREADFKGHQKVVHNTIYKPETKSAKTDSNTCNENKENQSKVIYKDDSEEEFYEDYKTNMLCQDEKKPSEKRKVKLKRQKMKMKLKTEKPNVKLKVQCPICDAVLLKYNLKLHLDIHSDVKQYKCTLCDKEFAQAVGLYNHMRSVHMEKSDQNKCNVCNKVFSTKHNMMAHQRLHTGEKPYVCKFCNKPFADRSALIRHERIHTKEYRYFCEICSKGFTDKSGLIGHAKRHSEKSMKCEICGSKFYQKSALLNHLYCVHSHLTPWECHDCGKKFKLKMYLSSHISNKHLKTKKNYKKVRK
ncbi:unnamed protein product [Leptosia nina]|uniref:C2H2-type domain-containing protein n=1 Tax=Leptosia nina TaxID=320188 RepID=A0AAV1JFY0_9NEOP